MNKNTSIKYILIAATLILAIGIPLSLRWRPHTPETHRIDLTAAKYGYTPERIHVRLGDTVIFNPTSKDVTHGFLLDGFPLEFIIKQQGLTLLKYSWEEDDGTIQADWDKVDDVEWVAERTGKFVFRCTQTCGNLHPFMTGEIIVSPNTAYHLAIGLSLWVVLTVLVGMAGRPKDSGSSLSRKRIDLLERLPWLKKLLQRRSFQFLLILPGFAIFYLFIISSLWGNPVGNHNIAIIFVWILWWFALKALFVPLGARLWCMICPLPAPAEWIGRRTLSAVRYVARPFKGLHHRFLGKEKDWPRPLRNMWLQNILFLCLISFGIILITRPVATASLFLLILGATLILAVFYRRRVFCLYLCPVGGFLGNYAMASVTELRPIDPDVCRQHKTKSCLVGSPEGWGCPWNQYTGNLQRNNYCGLCTECLKSCPKDNVSIFIRPFGSDLTLKGYDEMLNVLIMLVVAVAFSITMLGPWGNVKAAANISESRALIPFLIYLGCLWGSALIAVPGLFMGLSQVSRIMSGRSVALRQLALRLAYMFVPIGIFAWMAFSLPSIMVNYSYILNVLSDPLGLGWDLFGTAHYPYSPFYPEWVPHIQAVMLLVGLYYGIKRACQSVAMIIPDRRLLLQTMWLPALCGAAVVNIFFKLYLG